MSVWTEIPAARWQTGALETAEDYAAVKHLPWPSPFNWHGWGNRLPRVLTVERVEATDIPTFNNVGLGTARLMTALETRRPIPRGWNVHGLTNYLYHRVVLGKSREAVRELMAPGPPPPHPLRRLSGRLRLEEKGVRDQDGWVIPRVRHAGDLFALFVRDRDWAADEAKSIAATGAHGVRTWTVLDGPYWTSKQRDVDASDDWEQVVAFDAMLASLDLRWMVSQGDLVRKHPPGRWTEFMRQLAETLDAGRGLDGIIAVDVSNEAYTRPRGTLGQMAGALGAFLDVLDAPIRSITDSPENRDPPLRAWHHPIASVGDTHDYRGGIFDDKMRHIFSNVWEHSPPRRIISRSEGNGAFSEGSLVSVTEHHAELDAEAMGLLAAQQAIFRGIPVQFDSPGVSVRRRGEFSTMPGHATIMRVLDALPQTLHTWDQLSHGGTSQRQSRIFAAGDHEHQLRCDQVVNEASGEAAVTLYATAGTHRTTCERSVAGRFLDPRTGEYGPEQGYRSGESLTLEFARGRVFVGRLT